MVHTALEKGINFLILPICTTNKQSEVILGKALGNKRKDALIATKVCFLGAAGHQVFCASINAKYLIEQCLNSLKNLQTDYLDVLLLHNDNPITMIDDMILGTKKTSK